MKILFVDDQQDAIESLCKRIADLGNSCQKCEFHNANEIIRKFHPDIVILDLLYGDYSAGEISGWDTLEFIWQDHFCPVILYSAFADEVPKEIYDSNPFVERVKKGSRSSDEIFCMIEMFRSHVEVIKEAEKDVRSCFANVMKDVAPYAFKFFSDPEQRVAKIKHAGRRRIAALMDEPLGSDTALTPWEQYLFPPISNNIQMGDILVEGKADCDNPNAFCLVLTPSCDLVSGTREPKVKNVLVAKCCSMKDGLQAVNLANAKPKKIKERLLNQGYQGTIIPFPALENHIPTMAANLRKLDLIPIDNIGDIDSDKKFLRVASIDSPFREMIAWAYMQIACRPGLPDRDTTRWAQEIIEDIREREHGHESL